MSEQKQQTYVEVPIAQTVNQDININIIEPIIPVDSTTEEDKNLFISAYQYRKTVKIFTKIDGFFTLLNLISTSHPIFLMFLCMIYCGYYGADKYHATFVSCYIVYNLINLISSILFAFYLLDNKEDIEYTQMLLLSLNSILIALIIKISYSFRHVLFILRNKNLLHIIRNTNQIYITNSSWSTQYLH